MKIGTRDGRGCICRLDEHRRRNDFIGGMMEDKKLMPDSFYEERRMTVRWRQNTLPRAGIWLIDGRYEVAMYGSPAEASVREKGGILVAGVVFDRDHGERPVRGDVVLDIAPADDLTFHGKHRSVERIGWAPASN